MSKRKGRNGDGRAVEKRAKRSRKDKFETLKEKARLAGIQTCRATYNASHPTVNQRLKYHFDVVQALGKMSFANYTPSEGHLSADKPWLLENKKKASQLTALAERCMGELQLENGWRELETDIFRIFNLEVGW